MKMADTFKLSNKVREKSMVSLSVYNVGRQKCDPSYQWGPGIRDHYLIHLITAGKGTYTAGNRKFDLAAGDVFLVYPGTAVSYRADKDDPWEYRWVGFAGSDAALIMESTDFSPECPVLRGVPYGKQLGERLRRINRAFGNTFQSAVEMTGELYLALDLFVANASQAAGTGAADFANVRKAMDFIDSHYSYAVSIEDVARFVGVSRSTLFRQFRKFMNCSPKEYLDSYRIRRAARLLRETDLPVASIAASVGYDNGLYFSRAFHARQNVSPTQYRASHKA